jgi:hypothetical protein
VPSDALPRVPDVNRRPRLRLVLAALGVAGVVGSFAMLAVAAPTVAHRGASAAVYCLTSEKANRKQQLDQAKSVSASAAVAAGRAATVVTRLRKSVSALVLAQAKAKKTYWKTHRAAKARATFLAAQAKALKKAKASLAAAVAASARAQRSAASARTAQVTAQAAYDQCS